MKVLVIGQGGREHALVHALAISPSVTEVHCIPGNDGISQNALCHKIDWKDTNAILQICLRSEIDCVIIGPEDPLCAGLADELRERGILVVGPSAQGAKLEGSKIFAKNFMKSAGIPTAEFFVVKTVEETLWAAKKFQPPFVLKADGLAAGKGVSICVDEYELRRAATDLFEKKVLGEAGTSAILEAYTDGWELSYLVFTNGTDFQPLAIAQDHKRLLDADRGPNTGGMGTVAPLRISPDLEKEIQDKIVLPTLHELQKTQTIYRGVIFFGLMIGKHGPSLLEYNCRFGDPETQVLLPLIENDFGLVMKELSQGKVQPLRMKNIAATCVILASPGYPLHPEKGLTIEGDLEFQTASSYFLHAATLKTPEQLWLTNGGRVLCAMGIGSDIREATRNAYLQAEKVRWKNMLFRKDIGAKVTSSTAG